MFLLALGMTLYPVISNYVNEKYASEIHTAYEEVVQQADNTALVEAKELAIAYNEAITPGAAEEAYSQAALLEASVDYESQLNIADNGIMGYVEIPKINVNLPIYHGTGNDSLERGVGHLLGSSLPVGGESTHAILTGHSGMASQKMFTDLEQLGIGDVFYLHVLDETLAYQVVAINVVLPNDTTYLGISEEEDLCTLVTCTPYGVNKIVVIKPNVLRREYRMATHQIKLCTGGFGASPNSRGSACFCVDLYSGRHSRFERRDILGTLTADQLPQWALTVLEQYRQEQHEKNHKTKEER